VANYTFTNVTANHTISATFAIKTYTITATAGTNGSISPSGDVSVDCGADQAFKITADYCYDIADVLVDNVSQGAVANYTFTNVIANHTISATFSVITCTLTVNVTPSGGGNVTVNGAIPSSYPNSTTWVCGDNVTLNAVVASGYSFDHWGGALSGNATPVNITMDSNKDVIAYFTHVGIHYNLTVDVSLGGSGDIEVNGAAPGSYPHSYTFNESELVNLTAVPAGGYCFVNWSGDLSGSVNPTDITMTSDKNVTAHFTPIYNLTVTSDGCCPINVSGAASGMVSAGGSQTFLGIGEGGNVTVSADDSAVCCEFDSWSDTGLQTHNITMDDDKSVTAYCSVPSYDLTVDVTPGGGGNVTVNGTMPSGYPNTTTWVCGEEVTVNAVAASGYIFVNWSGDLSGSVNPTNMTMTSTKDVTAHFSAITYNLTVISDGCCPINVSGAASGTVSAGGSETFPGIVEGGNVTVSADDSAVCCEFDSWSDAGLQTHAITMDSDKSVTAYCSVPSYNLTVNVSPGGGNVTVNGATPSGYPNTTTWTCVEEVKVNAVAAGGYIFVNWSGNLSGSVNPSNITMNGDKSVTAHFSAVTYNLTVTSDGCCPIDVSGAASGTVSAGGSETFLGIGEGGNVTVSADDSAVCCEFDSWSDAGAQTHTITMDSDKSVTAYCSVPSYSLTVNVSPGDGGNVTVNGATPSGYPNSTTWTCGEEVKVNAVAAGGYIFVNWSGNLSGSVNPINITMTSTKDVTAHFSAITYNLTVTSNGCCPINVSGAASGTVSTGGSETFTGIVEGGNVTVSADDSAVCCEFDSWSDAGAQTHAITMDSDKSVTAYCSVPSYNLTVDVTPGGGNVTVNGTTPSGYPNTTTWTCGEEVTVNAVAAGGYIFVNWSGDLSGSVNPTNITMTSTKDVTAHFSAVVVTYNLTVNVTPGGSGDIEVNGAAPGSYPHSYTFNESEVVDLDAIADAGYSFVNWSGDLSGNATPVNITMDGDKSVTANFEEHLPKICVSPSSLPLTAAPNTTVTATYTITNCGGGILNWDSSNVTYVPNGNMSWFSQNITSGTLTANASDTVLVTVNTTGLEKGTYNAFITITGSTFILDIILDVTEPTDIDVMRDLPGNATWPNCTYPGDTFDVYVNFTSPEDDFNAIGLTDLAPDGWAVQTDVNWSSPVADEVRISGNKVEIAWYGVYNISTNFSALYKVTVPETADPGINEWPLDDCSKAWLEYYINWTGPNETCVGGEYQMMITVPSYVTGETRDVNANPLPDVFVILKRGNVSPVTILTDESTPDYEIICYNTGGDYWLRGKKNGYFTVDTRVVGDKSPHNVNLSPYIDWSTPELLAVGNVTDFEGDYGLVPKICDMSYALNSLNLWLFWPTAHEEWGLSVWKAMQSVDSWQNPYHPPS